MQTLRTILRCLAAATAGVVLAVAFVALFGYVALLGWDRTHPPMLPGLESGGLVLRPAAPGRYKRSVPAAAHPMAKSHAR